MSGRGHVMHDAAGWYDALAWVLTLGRERALRERIADRAALAPGERVLDVGCGTGSLALAARRRVGDRGEVHAIDAAPAMVARARDKARRAGLAVAAGVGSADALPYPAARFDVVLGTLVLHHLPRAMRPTFVAESRRVLRPSGRLVVVEFAVESRARRGLIAHVHRHGGVSLDAIVGLLEGAGLAVTARGALGMSGLQYAIGNTPPSV